MRAALLAAVLTAFALPSQGALDRQIVGGEQDHSMAAVGDCDHFYKTTFTMFPAEVREQEQREIALDDVDLLRVIASGEGGISIRGWNKPHARLIVCRTAVAQTKTHARRVLNSISVSNRDGEIAAHGPAIDQTQAWWANMILYVPRRTALEVKAANGGVALRNLSGKVTAHATSGGISVAASSGQFKIATDSGGITLDRVSGRVDAVSRDGAIALKVPEKEVPTIEARAGGGGHIICNITDNATWDASRKFVRIGNGYAEVRLATDATIVIDHAR
jgi:Putative adhesin